MILGRYEVIARLGAGASGTVFRARTAEGGDFAVKLIAAPSPDARARFARERRLLASVGEGFVPLLDAGEVAEGPFIVMPYLGGGTLRDRMRAGPLPVEAGRLLGIRLGDALGRAHAKGIVHRDLKPENVLFTEAGEPLVADLGLAKHFVKTDSAGSLSLSSAGAFRGTAGYMAPEQAVDAKTVDARADVFALACVIYEVLAGEPVFVGDSLLHLLELVETGRFVPLREKRPEVPRELAAAIERGLARDPGARFEDGAAFAAALRAPPRTSRRSALLVAAALVALAAAGVFLGATAAPRTEQAAPASPPPPPPPPPPVAKRSEPAPASDARAANYMGVVASRRGQHEVALGHFARAVAIDPRFAQAWTNLGNANAWLARHEDAVQCYTRALEVEPGLVDALLGRGKQKLRARDARGALADLEKAAALAPSNARAHENVAACRVQLGEYEKAREAADRAIALDPKLAVAWQLRAGARYALGDRDGAISDDDEAGRLDPRALRANCDWHRQRGDERAAKGDLRGALDDFDVFLARARTGDPEVPKVRARVEELSRRSSSPGGRGP